MRNETGKSSVFLILLGMPFTFLVTLIIVYVGIFGPNPPFEMRLKTQLEPGKMLTDEELVQYKYTLLDSVVMLKSEIDSLKQANLTFQEKIQAWYDSLKTVQRRKKSVERQLTVMERKVEKLKLQVDAEKQERMKRLTKIFQSLSKDRLDSLYVASLDDHTLMDIIAMAKAQQAAAVLSKVDPKRAARLTAKFVNPE